MIKSLRLKHYSYLVLAALLVVTSIANIFINLRTAQAETGTVTITSPAENEEIGQQTRQITGTAPALKELTVFDGSEKIGTTTSSGAGTWSLNWEDPAPGQHELRATVSDGTVYTPDFLNANSVKAYNFNNGQVVQNYTAGLSGGQDVFYDSGLQKAYVINYLAGTISQIDPVTKQIDATITYATNVLEPYGLPCRDNLDSITAPPIYCAFTYDEQSHALYLLDRSRLYIVNTQSKSLEGTVSLDGVSGIDGRVTYVAKLRLYLDQQREHLYILDEASGISEGYTSLLHNSVRVDLQTKTINTDESLGQYAVTTASNGDTYAVNEDWYDSSPYVKRSGSQDWEQITVPTEQCRFPYSFGIRLALSKDETRLYITCGTENDVNRLLVIDTTSLDIIESFERSGQMINAGNLTSEKLLFANTENSRIDVFDTTDNQFVSSIQPLTGELQKDSLVIDGVNERLYFATLDTEAALNHIYTADLHTSGIIDDRTYAITEFGGVQAAALSDLAGYLFISKDSDETLRIMNVENGSLNDVRSGIGSSRSMVVYARNAQKIFSFPHFSLTTAAANPISVASTEDASFLGKIMLPGTYFAAGGVLGQNETKLYVLGVDSAVYGGAKSMKIFEVDTGSLQITRMYEAFNDYSPQAPDGTFSEMVVGGDSLAFFEPSGGNGAGTVHILDLNEDTSRAIPIADAEAGSGGAQRVALNNDGSKLAFLSRSGVLSIINTTNLQTTQSINLLEQQSGMAMSVVFTSNNVVLAGVVDVVGNMPAGSSLKMYSTDDGSLIKKIDMADNVICIPGLLRPVTDGRHLAVFSICFDLIQQKVSAGYSVVDLENSTVIHSKKISLSSLTTTNGEAGMAGIDVEVLVATRHVVVRANEVKITSPAEGQTITAGEFVIEGTAPPGGTVGLAIDGQSIGSVQADVYGSWSKPYQFESTRTYQIKAEFTNPEKSLRYIPSFTAIPLANEENNNFGGFQISGQINVFDTKKDKHIDKITLPDGYVSSNATVGKDGKTLFIFAVKPNFVTLSGEQGAEINVSAVRLYKLNLDTKQFESPIDFAGTEIQGIDEAFMLALMQGSFTVMNEDQSKVYITNMTTGGRVFDIDGGLISEIVNELPGETPPFQVLDSTDLFMMRQVLAEEAHRLYTAFPAGIIISNLETNENSVISLPESVRLKALLYDKKRNNLVSFVQVNSDSTLSTFVSSAAVGAEEMLDWQVEIPNFYAAPSMVFSRDGEHAFLSGTNMENQNSPQYGAIKIRLSDGRKEWEDFQLVNEDIVSVITGLSILNITSTHGLRLNAEETKLYYDILFPTLAQNTVNIVKPLTAGSQPKAVRDDSVAQGFYGMGVGTIYSNASNGETTRLVAGTTIWAERTVAVGLASTPPSPTGNTGGSTNTVSPPVPNIPQIPGVTTPIVSGGQQARVSSEQKPASTASKTNKNKAIAALERKVLSRNFFAVARFNIKKVFADLPLPVIKSVPYVLYLALLALAGYYLYQTQKQLRREERIRKILTKQQVLTEEKRNFLELTSHYLRTPLTYIRSGTEMSARKTGNEQLAADMSQAVNHLSLFIESLIEEAGTEKNQEALKEVKIKSPLLSRNFLLPTLGLVGTLGIFYLLASGLAGITFASAAYFTHVVLTILIIRLFYGMLKNHRLVLAEKNQMSAILKAERELDHARSKLLEDAGEQLKTRTEHISGLSTQLSGDDTSKRIIQQGVERLQELSRAFRLVCKLEAQALVPQMKPVTAEDLASEVIAPFKDQLAEKKLTLNVTGFTDEVILNTNKPLAQLTLRSLIENAIQASKEGDSLVVKCLHSDGHTAFQVIDHGEGIPKEQLAQLFRPFVRVGPVTTFNREGIGLSLFLDRLIMHSLGGEVEIMSKFEQGTVATLTFATETA